MKIIFLSQVLMKIMIRYNFHERPKRYKERIISDYYVTAYVIHGGKPAVVGPAGRYDALQVKSYGLIRQLHPAPALGTMRLS
jgi:hypothetical protein